MAQTFTQLIRRLFWLLLALALIFFSVANRQGVALSFEPFFTLPPIPLFLLLFAGIFIGLIIAGGVGTWMRLQGFARRRKAERRAEYLEGQMASMAEDAHVGRAAQAHAAASDKTGKTGQSDLAKRP